MWSLLVCSSIFWDHACLYKIVWIMLQGDLNWILWHIDWRKNVSLCGVVQVYKSAWWECMGNCSWFDYTWSYERIIGLCILFIECFCMMEFGYSIYSCDIIVKHIIHFQEYFYSDSCNWYCLWMNNCCFEEVNLLFECFLCWEPGAEYWKVLTEVWPKIW